jgi:carbamoyltransferase
MLPSAGYASALRCALEILGREKYVYFSSQEGEPEKNDSWNSPEELSSVPRTKTRKQFLQLNSLGDSNIEKVDHHLSHAAGAYFTSGWEEALVVTCDGSGALLCNAIYIGKEGKLKKVGHNYMQHSIGVFWEIITTLCGFNHLRHGGKITGLAAYGDPKAKCYEIFRKGIKCKNLKLIYLLPGQEQIDTWKKRLSGFSREDIAATAQRRLEEVLTELIRNAVRATGQHKVALAGGVFANVKLNQRINELDEVDDIYVFPEMSDGGLALGSALMSAARRKRLIPFRLKDVNLGPEYSDKEIEDCLRGSGLNYVRYEQATLEHRVAELLTQGKVVARFDGRMEYGPRALGNRSILYHAEDPTVNDWLNKRLERTEFMPFAPVTLKEHAQKCYKNIKEDQYTARFMTITFDCTDWMKRVSPAVVHIDGTARPQIIAEEQNPSYYRIVKNYYEMTGIPTIVNTSFNMHEEPIVCSPRDAIRAFKSGHLNYMAIGTFLASNDSTGE